MSDVSLEVPEGSVVALLGSNGGGKTTTLNAIAGLIPPHSGSISFLGEEIGRQSAFAIVRKGLAVTGGLAAFRAQSVENLAARCYAANLTWPIGAPDRRILGSAAAEK